MKLSEISTRKLKKLLEVQKQTAPNSEAVRTFEKELMRREIERSKRYLSLEALAARLELPKKYLSGLAKSGAIPFLDIKGKMVFDLIGVVDSLARLNPQDQNIDKVRALYERMKGIQNANKKIKET